jgi:hypothetical protein
VSSTIENGARAKRLSKKKRGARRPLEYDSPKVDEVLTSSSLTS